MSVLAVIFTPVSASAVTTTAVSALAVTISQVSAPAVTPTPVSAPAVTPTLVSAPAITPTSVSTSTIIPARVTTPAVTHPPVLTTAVTSTLVSVPAVTPTPMSAHAVITAASLTKHVATSLATWLGKTARRLSTTSTALPTAIRQGKNKKDTGVGKASSRGLPTHRFLKIFLISYSETFVDGEGNWEELSLLLRRHRPVCVRLQETMIGSSSHPAPRGYSDFYSPHDRAQGHHGGTAFFF